MPVLFSAVVTATLVLLHYGKYLSRQLKNHLVIFKGRVFISSHLSALIFAFRLYYRNVLHLELPLKTTYRLQLMLNAAAWLLKDLFSAGLMQTQLSVYYSSCVFKVLLLESYTCIRVLHYLFHPDLNFKTSEGWNFQVPITNIFSDKFNFLFSRNEKTRFNCL